MRARPRKPVRSGLERGARACAGRRAGFRADLRHLVLQCLRLAVDLDATDRRIFDQVHRKRNLARYAGHLEVDEAIAAMTIRVARTVLGRLVELGPPAG